MSLLKLFAIFFAVNLFTIGGGYVMIPMLHDIFVLHYKVLTQKEFLDAVALGQLSPGPLSLMNVFIGYKLMGFLGAAAAALGTYLPSLTVVTLVVKYYVRFRESEWLDAAVARDKAGRGRASPCHGYHAREKLARGPGYGDYLRFFFLPYRLHKAGPYHCGPSFRRGGPRVPIGPARFCYTSK